MKAMLIIAILIVATLKSVQLEKAGLQEWDKACRKESGLNQGDEDSPEFKDYLMCMYIELELVDKEGHINKAKFKDIYPGSAILDNVDKCVKKFDEEKYSSLGDKLVNLQLCLDPHILPKK